MIEIINNSARIVNKARLAAQLKYDNSFVIFAAVKPFLPFIACELTGILQLREIPLAQHLINPYCD